MENEGLRLGMFLAGALMASVPVSLAIGIGVYALRRHLGRDDLPGGPQADGPGGRDGVGARSGRRPAEEEPAG